MLKIAIYGKGGIGKSTTSANLSRELARRGYSVIQVGCDPKHDSTRLLLDGMFQNTVLELAKDSMDLSLEDLIVDSPSGVRCIEVGGPEPGIGCAGRGLITAFDIMSRSDIGKLNADVMIYDVLGDVVCGGFAVPMRPENSDIIYIVTSGEFMSLYAANNIMRGLSNYDAGHPRLAGLVYNSRNLEDEERYVRDLADATGASIITNIPRSSAFADAEKKDTTVVEAFPGSDAAIAISKLADDVESHIKGSSECVYPTPLSDTDLDSLIKGRPRKTQEKKKRIPSCEGCCGHPGRRRKPFTTCASRGAVNRLSYVDGLNILVHGPQNCGFVMSYTRDNHSVRMRSIHSKAERSVENNIFCTEINDDDSVHGGTDTLYRSLMDVVSVTKGPIVVVTTCVPSMIGDNCSDVIERVKNDTGRKIDLIDCAGNFVGDADKGRLMAIDYLCSLAEPKDMIPGTVNLIDETFGRVYTDEGMGRAKELLDVFNLKVNSTAVSYCSVDDICDLPRAEFNMKLSTSDETMRQVRLLSEKGCTEYLPDYPIGAKDTIRWLRDTGNKLSMRENAEEKIRYIEEYYSKVIAKYSPILKGKRVLVVTGTYYPIGWLLDLMNDLGMVVLKVGVRRHQNDNEFIPFDMDVPYVDFYGINDLKSDMETLRLDMVVGHNRFNEDPGIPYCMMPGDVGSYQGSEKAARYLANVIRAPSMEGWMKRRFEE